MCARVANIKAPNASPDAGVAFFQNVVLPDLRKLDGFTEAMLLTGEDGEALVISLWDTEEHLRAGRETPAPHRAAASAERLGPDQARDVRVYRVAFRT
jgi:heme-degrading monooxygenase HmoA